FAPHSIQGGNKIHMQIDESIQQHDRVLLVLSQKSIASNWVRTEVLKAQRREVVETRPVLFPIRIMSFEDLKQWECFDADLGTDVAREIREYYIRDFSEWETEELYRQAFEVLLRDLRTKAS